MTEGTRNKWIGVLCTIVVHILLLCVLMWVVIKSEPVQAEAGGGVLVQFGNIDEASGIFEPDVPEEPQQEIQPETPAQSVIEDVAEEPLITQEDETTVAIDHEQEEKAQQEKEAQKLAEQQQKENERIENRLKNAFGKGVSETGSRGNSEQKEGTQGNPFGSTADGDLQGVGGYGGYSLAGRGLLGDLPRPQYDGSNDAGTIVVDITVDNKGRVINARIRVTGSEGSAASNSNLRNSALEAARRAVFESSASAGNQQGYIVYYFKQQ